MSVSALPKANWRWRKRRLIDSDTNECAAYRECDTRPVARNCNTVHGSPPCDDATISDGAHNRRPTSEWKRERCQVQDGTAYERRIPHRSAAERHVASGD